MLPGWDATAAQKKVYPRSVHGPWKRLRNGISTVLQGLLFALPWVQYQGRPLVLLDVINFRLLLGPLVLHPQDTPYLLLLLLAAAFSLFLVSALAGRVWCGYACPQTLLTHSFILVERWFEGDRAQRIRLDRAPWTREKLLRKGGKWLVWSAMGAWLGLTFAGYYMPIYDIVSGRAGLAAWPSVAFFTAISLFLFGSFREQVCIYLCPYSRFQSALIDEESLIVGYDSRRGEPRGKKGTGGDCVDCTLCVQVCPTGIDIRNGLQMECIACTACVDACDSVMARVGQDPGLIRYTSLYGLEGKKTRKLRPRVLVYALGLALVSLIFGRMAWTRTPIALDVVRVVAPGGLLAGQTPDGRITNIFKLDLFNRRAQSTTVEVTLEQLPGAQIAGPGGPWKLASGQVQEAQILVAIPGSTSGGLHPFVVVAREPGGASVRQEVNFVVP